MNCGLGESIAILRSNYGLRQPRAGTAACDWLEDSLHRVTKRKPKLVLCVKGKVKNLTALWRDMEL